MEVYEFRSRKVELSNRMIKQHAELKLVQREVPEEQHRFGPSVPEITDSDFPGKNIEVAIELAPQYCEKPKEPDPPVIPVSNRNLDLFILSIFFLFNYNEIKHKLQ